MSVSEYTREARYQKDTFTASRGYKEPRFKLNDLPVLFDGPFRHYFVTHQYPYLKVALLMSSQEDHYRTLVHYLYYLTGVNLSTQLYERHKPKKRYPITVKDIIEASQFIDVFLSEQQVISLQPIID